MSVTWRAARRMRSRSSLWADTASAHDRAAAAGRFAAPGGGVARSRKRRRRSRRPRSPASPPAPAHTRRWALAAGSARSTLIRTDAGTYLGETSRRRAALLPRGPTGIARSRSAASSARSARRSPAPATSPSCSSSPAASISGGRKRDAASAAQHHAVQAGSRRQGARLQLAQRYRLLVGDPAVRRRPRRDCGISHPWASDLAHRVAPARSHPHGSVAAQGAKAGCGGRPQGT